MSESDTVEIRWNEKRARVPANSPVSIELEKGTHCTCTTNVPVHFKTPKTRQVRAPDITSSFTSGNGGSD